jgi:hypothetical protein
MYSVQFGRRVIGCFEIRLIPTLRQNLRQECGGLKIETGVPHTFANECLYVLIGCQPLDLSYQSAQISSVAANRGSGD